MIFERKFRNFFGEEGGGIPRSRERKHAVNLISRNQQLIGK